jgi:hypothetical protein
MLIHYRCFITQEFLGLFDNVDESAICRAIKRIEALAKPLLGVRRKPVLSRKEAEALIVDCTEQPIQQPGTHAAQKAHYSGRKKRHTLKTLLIQGHGGCRRNVRQGHCNPPPAHG